MSRFSCLVVLICAAACGSSSEPGSVTITVTSSGAGAGTIVTSDGAIDCGVRCAATLPRDHAIELIATADAASQFAGWSGECAGTRPCELVLTTDMTVDAAFDKAVRRLSVVRSGTGDGLVTSTPAGIDCGVDCDESVEHGTSVVLVAAAAVESSFVGWSGGCTGVADCTVIVDADIEIGAAFARDDSLEVMKLGTGMGLVTSTPAGIDCGGDCEQVFPSGTVVTLAASPIGDAVFAGWGGACSGTGACVVTIDAAKSVTATFTQNQRTLTVMRDGTGTGTVTSDLAGIACGSDCSEAYDSGTTIVLSAGPARGRVDRIAIEMDREGSTRHGTA